MNDPVPDFVNVPFTVSVPAPSTFPLSAVIAPETVSVVSLENVMVPANAPLRVSDPAVAGVGTLTVFAAIVADVAGIGHLVARPVDGGVPAAAARAGVAARSRRGVGREGQPDEDRANEE